MRILFAGTPKNAARTLEALLDNGVEISLVLTRPDSRIGRKGILTPSPVAQLAEARGLQVIKETEITQETLSLLRELDISFGVVVAFGVILRQETLSALSMGWYNLHYSRLPRWRGAAPVQRALLAGDTETGVTLFKIDTGLDTGPVLSVVDTSIAPRENFGELLGRLTELGITLLLEQIPGIVSGTATFSDQASEGISYAPKIGRLESKVNFSDSSRSIENLVRATNPEPGSWATVQGSSIKILDALALGTKTLEPGCLSFQDGKVLVGAADADLLLIRVHPSGKREMLAADWCRGLGKELPRFDLDG